MLLITISWIYILFTTINLGFIFDKIVGIKNNNFVITSFFGLFTTTILASLWAIFGRINIEFNILILIINLLTTFFFRKELISIYQLFYSQLKLLSRNLSLFLFVITLFIIAQCASIPFLIDNESYYIQTIKWLNEYGFVKGIANLHLFLGQTSGWHITQSAFNFSFLYKNFNDLSGFCLLLGNIFAIQKLNEYTKNNSINYLIIGLMPFLNLFFFQFISAPSPDLPVYILSFLILFYFMEYYKKPTNTTFHILFILALFAIYIKITALPLLLFLVFIYFKNIKNLKINLIIPFSISIVTLLLFIIKNTIISGYPLYPIHYFVWPNIDYAFPEDILVYMFYEMNPTDFTTITQTLFYTNSIDSLFNWLTLFIIIITPFAVYKKMNYKPIWIIYFVALIQIVLMIIISPQYRFYIHFVFFLGIILMLSFFKNHRVYTYLLTTSLIVIAVVLFFPLKFNKITDNKHLSRNSTFTVENIIYPYQNSKINSKFDRFKLGNLTFYSPVENDFFWASGNGVLPCVNKKQIDFFGKNLRVIPQMRTNNLKDGFYAQQLSENK